MIKSKFALQQSQYRSQGKFIELMHKLAVWIQNDREVQSKLLPYFYSQIGKKERKLLSLHDPEDTNNSGERILEVHLLKVMLKHASRVVRQRRLKQMGKKFNKIITVNKLELYEKNAQIDKIIESN